jgi:competence protein ComEC
LRTDFQLPPDAARPTIAAVPAPLPDADSLTGGLRPRRAPPELDSLWRAPLAPVALAFTAGVVADRLGVLPTGVAALLLFAGLGGWAVAARRPFASGLPFLWLAVAALGALHHHQYRDVYPTDDIGHLASEEPRLARVRGRLIDGPISTGPPRSNPLRSMPPTETSRAVLAVSTWQARDDWLPVSGRVRLTVPGRLDGLRVGDEVEATGWLAAPSGPMNPGEADVADRLRDDRIRAVLTVRESAAGVVRLSAGTTLAGGLAAVRGWGTQALADALPPDEAHLAAALLLGDTAALAQEEWDKYVRTGVVHALAISGQHLVVLAAFLWLALRVTGVRRKHGAWAVALLLVAYALLTGARPPAVRAAAQVAVVCGGLVLRRPALPANAFALAWLVVLAVQPTDVADLGCQLSFLCVAVLTWGTARWFAPRELGPLEQLVEESRSPAERAVRWLGRVVLVTYGVTVVLGLAVLPLVAARYHLISPVGLLIGPPVVLLTSVALVAGFLLLVCAAVLPWLVPPFAWATRWSLAACAGLVDAADRLPLGHGYVGGVPPWWLLGFYPVLLAVIFLPELRRRARWLALAGLGWLAVGLAGGSLRPAADELRLTFLAVGHGGCTVIETPDGRALLYDAGALAGPGVTRRVIAPFLWHRGVRRLDEVIVSHADLDHFNGLPALLDRFTVGRVTLTPSFADRTTPGVREALVALERSGVATRTVQAGDVLTAGDVTFEVLHPPAGGPPGPENVRSLVLLVRHAGHAILLTGDVEGEGLERVLRLPPVRVDVLQAPHHGSKTANPAALAAWARPRLVVACQGPPPWPTAVPETYAARGARYLGTWPHGAVTVRSHRSGLLAETFRTGERAVVRAGSGD